MSGTLGARLRASLAVGAAFAAALVIGAGAGAHEVHAADPAVVTVSKTTFTQIGDGSETVTVSGTGFDPAANVNNTDPWRPPIQSGKRTGVYVVFGRFADVWKPSASAPSTARKVIDQKWALPQDSIDTALGGPNNPQYVPLAEDGSFTTTLTIRKDDTKTGNYGIVTYAAGGAVANPDQETFTPITFVDVDVSQTSFLDIGDGSETVTVSGTGFDPAANVNNTDPWRPPIQSGKRTGVYVVFGRFADVWKPSASAPSTARKVIDQKWALPQDSIDTALGGPNNPQYVPLAEDGSFTTTLTIRKDDTKTGNYGIVTYAAGGAVANPDQETFTPITFVDTPKVLELVTPARVLDTRPGAGTIDGESAGGGLVEPGTPLKVQVAGRANVPADATAVSLNLTATGATSTGYVTVWACGEPQPGTSSINLAAGVTVANVVIAEIGEDGSVCFATGETGAHLIADVAGYATEANALAAVSPTRLLDTREDGAAAPTLATQPVGVVRTVQVGGEAGVPDDAQAAVLNVTATDAAGTGYVTVWPCDATAPTASNLNSVPGRAVAAGVIASLSADGTVCLATGQADAALIVDVVGYVPAFAAFQPLTPARLLDTRAGTSTVDGEGIGAGVVSTTTSVKVAGRGGVDADATAVVLSVTADGATADGYVTVWSCGEPQPYTSNLNVAAGQPAANGVIVALGTDGEVCLAVGDTTTNLIVDVLATLT